MKSYHGLTIKYLKANKKRTALTILGIVLAVSLITTIGLFFMVIQQSSIDYVKKSVGSYHIGFINTDESFNGLVKAHKNVKSSGLVYWGEPFELNDAVELTWLYASKESIKLLPYVIEEGEFPANEGEIALEGFVLKYLGKDLVIGSPVTIEGHTYTLSGIIGDGIGSQYQGSGTILTGTDATAKADSYLLVSFKKNTPVEETMDQLIKASGNVKSIRNDQLIAIEASGNYDSMAGFYGIIGIVISIVIIATIAVIYNAFHIGVVWRIKQFGLLRAIGGTTKQIARLVLVEALIIACIAIPIGLLASVFAIYCIYWVFNIIGSDLMTLSKPVIEPMILMSGGILGLITVLISAYLPAKQASRISPLVAISSRFSIKKEKVKKRKPLLSYIMKIEGKLALQNIKRNPTRYRVTLFSISLSVVLFVVFTAFIDLGFTIKEPLNESTNIHFDLYVAHTDENQKGEIPEELILKVQQDPLVLASYVTYPIIFAELTLNEDEKINEMLENYGVYFSDGNKVNAQIAILDEAGLNKTKKYLLQGSAKASKLNEEMGVVWVKRNTVAHLDTGMKYVGPISRFKVGQSIRLDQTWLSEPGDGTQGEQINLLGITEFQPFDLFYSENSIKWITSEQVGEKLIGQDIKPEGIKITLKDTKNEQLMEDKLNDWCGEYPGMAVTNYRSEIRNYQSIILLIQILLYGFVIVVSLIGCVNIVNTLTTNLLLRTQELALIKAIGMSQRSLIKMILTEGLLYGVMGSIYGGIVSLGLVYLMYQSFNMQQNVPFSPPFVSIGIASLAAIGISYLAVLFPLKKLKGQNLIEITRQDY